MAEDEGTTCVFTHFLFLMLIACGIPQHTQSSSLTPNTGLHCPVCAQEEIFQPPVTMPTGRTHAAACEPEVDPDPCSLIWLSPTTTESWKNRKSEETNNVYGNWISNKKSSKVKPRIHG